MEQKFIAAWAAARQQAQLSGVRMRPVFSSAQLSSTRTPISVLGR